MLYLAANNNYPHTHWMLTGLPMELFTKANGLMERKMGMVFSHILMAQSMKVHDMCFASVMNRNVHVVSVETMWFL